MMDETQTPVDTTQQVTSKVPTTHVKNPKRVAAGKATAERTRQAREAQKKKMAEADLIFANEQLKKAQEGAKKADEALPDTALPDTALPDTAPPDKETVSQTLTTTQWLSVISIAISLVGIYYKRQEIKNALSKIKAPASNSQTAPASANAQTAPASANAQTAPVVVKTPKEGGIRLMA